MAPCMRNRIYVERVRFITPPSAWRLAQLFLAAKPSDDRHRTAQQYYGGHGLTRVNLGRRYRALIVPVIVIVPLMALRLIILAMVIAARGKGEVCSQRQKGR